MPMEKHILMNSKKQKKEITCVLNWRFNKDIKIHKYFEFFLLETYPLTLIAQKNQILCLIAWFDQISWNN